ncbi:hypothetical protein JS528_01815 [Bifidobacterium sp. MA2]|uniref:Uncharacterized protein n=1 Tax=Bifidobacterium santillanense TaxID=2809028 RepID=A0ABS5UMH8_9BIFI|nr:hypothetical protein [Bifidobacterium santillanense]MBT1172115.1 hypothetical protein [Bifidobacterium santillanense]
MTKTHGQSSTSDTTPTSTGAPSKSRGWPQPKRNGGLPANDPKREFANAVRSNAVRRAMPFKATGHKGGISFR